MPNSYASLTSDSPYDLALAKALRDRQTAEGLRQQASDPIQVQQGGGAPAPISWASILAKGLQGATAGLLDYNADKAQKTASEGDRAAADALVRQLTGQDSKAVGAPAMAPQTMNVPAPAGLPSGQVTIPGQAGGGVTSAAPDFQSQIAMLLGAQGGPQTQAIKQAMLPQVMNRQNTLDERNYENQQAQMRPATAQEKAQIGLDAKTPALVDAHGNIKPITDPNQITAYQNAELGISNRQLGLSAAQQAESARHNRVQEQIAQNPFGTGLGVPGADGKTGKDFLSTLPPGLASQIQAVGTYRQPAPAGRTSPTGIKFMTLVNQAFPDYDASQYGTKTKARNDFSTGKNGNTVRSLNVAVQHLDQLGQLSQALGNGNMQLFNKIGQSVAQQTGSPAPTNFDAAKQLVGDEIVKAIVGAGGGVGDREAAAANISRASSPQQLAGVIQTYKGLMAGQLGGLKQQYEKNTGLNDFENMLAPETQAQLQHHLSGAGGGGGARKVIKYGDLP